MLQGQQCRRNTGDNMKKNCAICDAEFEAKKSNAKYCANKCAVAAYRKRHPERVKANRQKRRNTDEFRAKHNAYEKMRIQRPEVKEKIAERRKELYYTNDGNKIQQRRADEKYGKPPTLNCKECGVEFQGKLRVRNVNPKDGGSNKEKYCSKSCKYKHGNRVRNEDIAQYISGKISRGIRHYLGKYRVSKGGRAFDDLPYSPIELCEHLESQFTDGMSWENRSEWHIDHIRPVASFDFDSTDHPDFKKCWALNNLQPLWAADNIRKGAKWDGVVNA